MLSSKIHSEILKFFMIFLLSSFQFIFRNLVRSLPLAAKFVRSVYVLSDQLLVLVLEIEPVTINCSKSETYSTASCPYVSGKGHNEWYKKKETSYILR